MAADEVEKPPSLPPYAEMILAAISALNDKDGSNRSAISKYIESSYGDLPSSHSSLLAANLARMKESGELVVIKNNYLRGGPEAPPKRGRGRPPKPRAPLPPGSIPPTPRPRGRPPKPKDPLAAAVAKAASGFPRRRGRPPKARPSGEESPSAAKRPRGRPRKVPAPCLDVGFV